MKENLKKKIIYIFNSFKYVIQHLFISTLTILTEQEIMHFNKQNTIACSLQPSVITRTAVGNPPGLRGRLLLRGRLPYLPVLALEIANSLAMSDISVGWTQGSLSGPTPPSALPNSDNTSGAL